MFSRAALVNRDELKGIANALKQAKRARVSFEGEDVTKPSSLIIDTELICYKWVSVSGNYPEYEKLIPTEFNTLAHFDTVEAIKACNSLKVLANSKAYPIDLTIGNGKVVMANTEDKGQAELNADTDGEARVRIDGGYLIQALRACGGMVEFKVTNAYAPTLFTANGYQLVVMPQLSNEANEQMKRDRETKTEAKPSEPAEAVAEIKATEQAETVAVASEPTEDTEPVAEHKPKRNRKQAVAVT